VYINRKMIPIETVPRIRGGGVKESSGWGDFKEDILNTL
jgi:hypothetical protein